MEKKVNVILPMRAGSQRIVNKNIRLISGKPLYQESRDSLLGCKFVDKIVISTDIQEILDKYNE